MAVALPFIGAAIGSSALAGTALAAYGASIGWIAGSNLGASTSATINQVRTETCYDDPQRPS